MKDIEKIVKLARNAMEDKKAIDVKVIYIGEISVMADYFIICSASSSAQMEAIVDNVGEELGNRNSGWILMDYGDIVVHVFMREDRDFYNLERIWRDGKIITED